MKYPKILLLIILFAANSNSVFTADHHVLQEDVFALDDLLGRLANDHEWDIPERIAKSVKAILNHKELQSMNIEPGIIEHLLIDKLNAMKIDLNVVDRFNSNALHFAAYNGYVNIVNFLINAGLCINVQNKLGNTPLHMAAAKNERSTVIALLQADADKYIENVAGLTASQEANMRDFNDLVYLIRDWNRDIVKQETVTEDAFEETPLDTVLEELINAHEWNEPHKIAKSLHAILNCKKLRSMNIAFEIIENLLLDKLNAMKIDLTIIDATQNSALHFAAIYGHDNAIKFLLNAGLDINAKDRTSLGYTPLHRAVDSYNHSSVITLLQAGANKKIKDAVGLTAEQIARKKHDNDLANLIRDWPA